MGFPINKHNAVGLELAELHDRMLQVRKEVYDNYPNDSQVWIRANRAAGAIMELRCELDACASREHGQNKEFDPFGTYFSRLKERKLRSPHPKLPSPEFRQ